MPAPLIFGTGSLARLAHHYITQDMGLPVRGFVVDAAHHDAAQLLGLPVHRWEQVSELGPLAELRFFVAIGYKSMRQREAAFNRIRQAGGRFINVVCRTAYVAASASMGENNFVMPGAVIEPGVVLGANNVVWSNATVCHDSCIGDHNFVASNVTIGGEVVIGSRCFFGFASVVLQTRRIGDDVLIGAGSLMLGDADPCGQYQGSPAQKVRDIDPVRGIEVANS